MGGIDYDYFYRVPISLNIDGVKQESIVNKGNLTVIDPSQ